ncbi:MAG: hypothetical protein QXX77_01105 [Candidatus Methanosuratincola sp.]
MIVFGLRITSILLIAVLLGFAVTYAPLFAFRMIGTWSQTQNGSLDFQTSQPKDEHEVNGTENYAIDYNDRISEAIPDSPAAPFLGPILVVSIGLIVSATAYISLKRKLRVLGG